MKLLRVVLSILFSGVSFLLFLTIGTLTGLVQGLWMESDRMAGVWEGRRGRSSHGGPLTRLVFFVLMILYLVALVYFSFVKQ
jgi:hypothetical protein